MITRLPAIHGPTVTAQAAAFAAVWLERLGDKARQMVCDARLVKVAQDHAEFLAQRTDTSMTMHIGRNGSTANQRVRQGGYHLPAWHGDGNTVESCTRSWKPLDETVDGLMASPAHYDHTHGIGWFAGHVVWGIGSAAEYFVLVSCPVEELL